MDKVFTKYEDCSHGWLKVSFEDLINLNIQNKISNFSYMEPSGDSIYLEEDYDMTLFMKSYKEKCNKGLVYCVENNEEISFIRNLPSYIKGV